MASRLSEESVVKVYDAGSQNLSRDAREDARSSLVPHIDFNALLMMPDARERIQALDSQHLYAGLKQIGVEDAIDVLPMVSDEQWVRLVDYDGWHHDEVAPRQVFQWLDWHGQHGKAEVYRRFREMEEETQLTLVSGLLRMYTLDEIDNLPETTRDRLRVMPCNKVFYLVDTDDLELERQVCQLIDAAIQENMEWAYQLLAYATHAPSGEAAAQAAVFRKARLEEDGFVTYEESLGAFKRVDLGELRRKWGVASEGASAGALARHGHDVAAFLPLVMSAMVTRSTGEDIERTQRGMVHLANMLCAAADVEPGNIAGLELVLSHARNMVGLGLDVLVDGDIENGVRVFSGEHPQTLFRAGLSAIDQWQRVMLDALEAAGVPSVDQARRAHATGRWGRLLMLCDTAFLPVVGFERAEFLKGLFNRFPMALTRRLRGADGVEKALFGPVSCRAGLATLAGTVGAMAAELALARQSLGGETVVDLDRAIATSVARVLVGGPFEARPLSDGEASTLTSMGESGFASGTDRVRGVLENALTRVHVDAPVATQRLWEGVEGVIARLRDACETARRDGADALGAVIAVSLTER